jgi:hypothetical protein
MAHMARFTVRSSGSKLRNNVKTLVLEMRADADMFGAVFVQLDEMETTNHGEPKVFSISEAINLVLGEMRQLKQLR